jgi:putative ABC transport system ATP-binding protein
MAAEAGVVNNACMTAGTPGHEKGCPALEVRGITRSFATGHDRLEVLHELSFCIEHGAFVSVVGPSGSGKSTLLGIIAGLDNPSSGQVFVDGVDITFMSENALAKVRNEKIGVVFQSFNLIPTLTALENAAIPLNVGHHSGNPEDRAGAVLDLVGLSHRLGHRPNELSGGEQQRVAIARALVTEPAIVIMDEPTGNLDAANSRNVLDLIGDLQQRTGTTIVVATHDPLVAETAPRVIQLIDGRIVRDAIREDTASMRFPDGG